MKYRKKPVVIDATQWFKNGDHPEDYPNRFVGRWEGIERADAEGLIVRHHRQPNVPGADACAKCSAIMHVHGWVDTLEGGHIVCPGDWIITGIAGEYYPCKPDIFNATYETVE